MKKIIILSVFFFSIVSLLILTNFVRQRDVFAENACNDYPTEALKQQCIDIENQIREYEAKLDETKKKEGDIKQNIDYLDNQIYLSKLRIQESEIIIQKRKQDIENLINNIILLEDSLNKNTKLFLRRVNLSYRQGNLKPYMVFFGSGNIADKMSKFKYLQIVQSADRQFLFKIQETKNSYSSQKKLVEEEKKALENENKQLEERKAVLAGQVQEKEVVLAQTQSEANVLSATIENLRAQRSNLFGGVASVISSNASCQTWTGDDSYFNQADCRWGNVIIGNANYADDSFMWKYGCAATAVAISLKHSGVGVDPQVIAQNSTLFAKSGGYQTDLIIWSAVASNYGKTLNWLSGWNQVDEKLSQGKWVIVHVMVGGYGWGHYVVLTSKDGNGYKMHDPYFGNNLNFYDRYSGADQMMVYE